MKTVNTPKENNQPLRVIVVSSNPLTQMGLRMMLGSHPNIALVGEVSGHLHAVEQYSIGCSLLLKQRA